MQQIQSSRRTFQWHKSGGVEGLGVQGIGFGDDQLLPIMFGRCEQLVGLRKPGFDTACSKESRDAAGCSCTVWHSRLCSMLCCSPCIPWYRAAARYKGWFGCAPLAETG